MTSAHHQPNAAAVSNVASNKAPSAGRKSLSALATVLAVAWLLPLPVRAADGCLVLLCLAAPSWQNIAQCVDPVRQVLRDLMRGHPFPTCPMGGAGNSGSAHGSNAPTYCPPQYTRVDYADAGTRYRCDYQGAVEIHVNGSLWTRTWWSESLGSVTEFTPAAKAQLGHWETRFDDDYAAWLAAQVPAAPTADAPVN